MKKTSLLIQLILLLLTVNLHGQNKKSIEEVAFYHLDSIIKLEPQLKRIKYFANGFVSKDRSECPDSLTLALTSKKLYLRSAFKELTLVENEKLSSITIPKSKRGRQRDTGLKISHFTRNGNLYYVEFEIMNDGGIDSILIEMNELGDMTRYIHSGACF